MTAAQSRQAGPAPSGVETAFRQGLLDAAQPVPDGLRDGAGRGAGRRYAVYRNNVAVSLREALETGFPAVAKLIGAEAFAHVAGLFLRAEPPRSPRMMLYGAGFPAFLDGFEPLRKVGYLGDVARLEYAMRLSYHAADAAPLDPARLQALHPDALSTARLTLAPAVQVIRSPWPVLSIWRFTLKGGAKPQATAEDVLIARPGFDPSPHLLPHGGAAFVAALRAGAPFAGALKQAGETLDLAACLSLLLAEGALTDLN